MLGEYKKSGCSGVMKKSHTEILLWFWRKSHFCVKQLVLIGILLIKEYKSTVNGLVEII